MLGGFSWTGLRWPPRAYPVTAAAVLLAYGVRVLLEPMLQGNHPYLLFYPIVLVAAYVAGRGPAILGAGFSAALGFWSFAEPSFGLGLRAAALTPLLFFFVTCAVAIYLITELTGALARLARDQGRLQAVADAHAGLFKDLQGRIGHHMSLVASVLSFQARGEPDPEILALLRKAGERSQLIAQALRPALDTAPASIDFAEFARALARVTCVEQGQPESRVEVIGEDVVGIPLEVATSLGVALAECLTWILARKAPGITRLEIKHGGGRLSVRLGHSGDVGVEAVAIVPAAYMFRAMVEQLGASVELLSDEADAAELELSVPLPPSLPRSTETTLH